jgi:NRPS condensation-like uncharacterized protein
MKNSSSKKATQGLGRASWIRLDNASKIFPATANYQDTKVFRITAELNEPVDPVILQQAVDAVMPRFPSFNTVLRRGVFWYYFEQSELTCTVQPETEELYEPLYIRGEKILPYRILYYGNRINAEIFHAVCDGAVAVTFLRALVGQYLLLRHPEVIDSEDIRPLFERSPAGEKLDDSFKRYFKYDSKLHGKKLLMKEKTKRVRAWRVRGTKLVRHRASLIEGTMPLKAISEAAKAHNATLTVYISAIYAKALWEVRRGDKPRPIILSIPVNLRSLFPSRTERNFFSVIYVTLPEATEEEAMDLSWWIRQVSDGFKDALDPEKMAADSSGRLKLEANPVLRVFPTGLKDLSLRLAHNISDRHFTSSVSNVGRFDLPEKLQPYLRCSYASVVSRSISMTALSSAGLFAISFISVFKDSELQYRFFTSLQEAGVPVEITSNMNIVTAVAGDQNGQGAILPPAEGVSPGTGTICPNCGCAIRGYKARCPLDNEPLQLAADARSDQARDVFPATELKTNTRLLTKLFAFISIAAMIISLMLYYALELPLNLPMMTLFGIISTWTSVGAVVLRRRHVSKIITWQVTILSLLMLAWDWMLGWQGWSLNYSIPIVLLAAQATLYILAEVLHMESGDYIVYLLLCGVLGLLPLLFLVFSWVTVRLPSVICVGVSFLMIVGTLIFQGGNIRHELAKRLHI